MRHLFPLQGLKDIEAENEFRNLKVLLSNQLDIRVDLISEVLITAVVDLINRAQQRQDHPEELVLVVL